MASSPVTAPSPETSDSPTPPSSSSSPPAPPTSSSPPPESPPSPSEEESEPETSPPPPPPTSSSPKKPPSKKKPPQPPSDDNDDSSPSPPTNKKSSRSPPSSGNVPFLSPPSPPKSSSSSSSGALSPPTKTPSSRTNKSSNSSSSMSSSDDKIPLIIGITVGVSVVLVLMIVMCVYCFCKRKRRSHDQMHYYMDPARGPVKVGEYYNSPMPPNYYNSPQSMEHGMKVPSPPVGGWHAPPPPPPMMSSSGEMSSNYSGPHHPPLPPPSPNIALGFNKSTFTYDELAAATGGFSQANLLGQGGFGFVHKGVLANGKQVAVKSLKSGSGQGEREFQAEVEIISRVHHRHLVSLVGYCIAGGQRMLVYEYVPNKTLEYHLYSKNLPTMDWPTRVKIALGSAKGLAYLHEDCHPRIIHRDIKAANILLDHNFEAMVADFGLAKLSSDNYTHVSTRVMGTFGYLAPEYASSGKLTEKSDVFSFGVMLLELITGRRPVDTTNTYMEDSLVDWARPILTRAMTDGNYSQLVDPRLENRYEPSEMANMVTCAAASIRHSARRRPKMSQIVRALEGDVSLDDLNEGVKPGQSTVFGVIGSSEYDANAYNADMIKFRKMALESQEMSSSEYGDGSSSGDSADMNQSGNQRRD
ncbi:PREDICTED: proline-rich receptor-like protein kinase PERK4 [Nelumbo nucifera]|uniref:non-specific serine/threonine protein kinase n=2 Tax=Nelumbo nucifera TaxID=4432 RepID=A0A1U8A1B8_NELNU|nr:PREDICTED: proline-rich receptor-like protein kinase PERK4 [Nelumbo nucifera]XP_019053016.1 PREDICTED: proline-rich receptor-like protein kinase PERK4 [Nelumbo nucifera]DAD40694.1 TPA_asm: hypothetical protein HUJ06_015017 [Nelumbo nucifera]